MISQIENMLDRKGNYMLLVSDNDPDTERKLFVEFIVDDLISEDDSDLVHHHLSEFDEIAEFYKTYGSMELFAIDDPYESGIYIERPGYWEELYKNMSGWVKVGDESDESESIPAWLPTAIVFGYISCSSVYFLLVTEGDESGSIFEFDHDGLEFNKLATNFDEFVSVLSGTGDTLVGLLNQMMSPYANSGWESKKYCTSTHTVELTYV